MPRRGLGSPYSSSETDLEALAGMHAQAALHGLDAVVAGRLEDRSATAMVLSKRPDYVLICGDGSALGNVVRELERLVPSPTLMAFTSIAQSGVRALPAAVAASALFSAPALPPDIRRSPAFFSILGPDPSHLSYPGFRAAAFAAGTVLLEALRSSGRRFSRESLVAVLEHLQNFETGVIAPLSFGTNRRIGTAGAVVMGVDPQRLEFVPQSGWITPKQIQ
jgi:Periplasmic binding protein